MPEVLVIRHAQAAYPDDRITDQGRDIAVSLKKSFEKFETVVCSPKVRSGQTAKALGFDQYTIDKRLVEFEAKDIITPTAEDYVRLVHSKKWKTLVKYGENLLSAIVEYGQTDDVLMVAHNAVMSATYRILTGEINPFENLSGFQIKVENGEAKLVGKI